MRALPIHLFRHFCCRMYFVREYRSGIAEPMCLNTQRIYVIRIHPHCIMPEPPATTGQTHRTDQYSNPGTGRQTEDRRTYLEGPVWPTWEMHKTRRRADQDRNYVVEMTMPLNKTDYNSFVSRQWKTHQRMQSLVADLLLTHSTRAAMRVPISDWGERD